MVKANVDKILEVLRERKSASIGELSREIGLRPDDVQKSAEYLEQDGVVKIEHKFPRVMVTLVKDTEISSLPPPPTLAPTTTVQRRPEPMQEPLPEPIKFGEPLQPMTPPAAEPQMQPEPEPVTPRYQDTSPPAVTVRVAPIVFPQQMPGQRPGMPMQGQNRPPAIPQVKQPSQSASPPPIMQAMNNPVSQNPIPTIQKVQGPPARPTPLQTIAKVPPPAPRPRGSGPMPTSPSIEMPPTFPSVDRPDDVSPFSQATTMSGMPISNMSIMPEDPLDMPMPGFNMNPPMPTDKGLMPEQSLTPLESSMQPAFNQPIRQQIMPNIEFQTIPAAGETRNLYESKPVQRETYPDHVKSEMDRIEYILDQIEKKLGDREYSDLNVLYRKAYEMYTAARELSPNESYLLKDKLNEAFGRIKETYLVEEAL
jgi:hypothetical protein